MFGVPGHRGGSAVDVEREEPRGLAGRALGESDDGPDDVAVGVGEREGIDLFVGVPVETALVHVMWDDGDGFENSEVEEEPVAFALVGAFGYEALEVEVGEFDAEAGFFVDFALGAVRGGFAGVDVELAADRGAQAQVGGLDAFEEEDAALGITEVAEAGEAVGEFRRVEHGKA